VHSAFQAEVEALGRTDLTPEVSYRNGEIVKRGTSGSIRLDVVEGPVKTPTAIYDLKTGSATLTLQRIAEIRQHLPAGYQNIPNAVALSCFGLFFQGFSQFLARLDHFAVRVLQVLDYPRLMSIRTAGV